MSGSEKIYKAHTKFKFVRNRNFEVYGEEYLRQYISGQQVGRGMKTSKKFIKSIGVFEFEEVRGITG